MAIKELFYDLRPVALLNPRESRRIDARFKYSRADSAYYVNDQGDYVLANADEPRFAYNFDTGEFEGLLIEGSSTNIINYSATTGAVNGVLLTGSGQLPTGWGFAQSQPGITATLVGSGTERNLNYIDIRFAGTSTAPNRFLIQPKNPGSYTTADGETYTISIYAKLISGTVPAGLVLNFNIASLVAANLTSVDSTLRRYTGTGTVVTGGTVFPRIDVGLNGLGSYDFTIRLACPQLEVGTYASSPIIASGTTITRPADLLTVNSLNIPSTGSLFVDSKAEDTATGSTLLSLKNASNQQINLAIEERSELYNSPALVYSLQGSIKPTLPFPVPGKARNRNIITWGANNYQYTRDSARFAQSLSGSVPANLNQLSIGSDSVDPTKSFNGYINSVYLYSGEITPTVAEAFVRGELDPINADTFVPTGPAGSLSLIVNTQGASFDGDTVFELPAESVANNNDIVITWGDNTESGLENAAAELGAPGLTKTYSSAGLYSIFIEGRLENLRFNNSASAPDLVQIVRWGTTANGNDVFLSPSTMNSAFFGCSQLDFSSTARTTNLPDTSAVTDWRFAFYACSSITGIFPQFNFSAATDFTQAWRDCSSLTGFTAAGNQTQNVTNLSGAWLSCTSLAAFPNINTSSVTNFDLAWANCISLSAFPGIITSAGTSFDSTWSGCTGLLTFPSIVTSNATALTRTWSGCTSLTAFPFIDTSSATTLTSTWFNCSGLNTQFPLISTSNVTSFDSTWYDCTNLPSNALTPFPLIDTSAATSLFRAWRGCSSFVQFPAINTVSVTQMSEAWFNCSSLAAFPSITTDSVETFARTWSGCSSLTVFPSLNFDSAVGTPGGSSFTGLRGTWLNCTSLTTFPANRFDSTLCTEFFEAWKNCALTVQSIENILVSLVTAGQTGGTLSIDGGGNASKSTWSVAANNAYDTLADPVTGRGWTIFFKP